MSTPLSIHQRSYQTEAFDEGDGVMRVTGRLTDTKPQGLGFGDGEPLVIHDMEVSLHIRMENFEIVGVDSTMHVHPYDECPGILSAYDQLVGKSVARGYSRTIKDLFGGPNGCSHVGALLIAMGPVVIQASWSFTESDVHVLDRESDDSPEALDYRIRMNTNTCHIWSEDGEQIALMRRGETPVSPAWHKERTDKLHSEPRR